ncbi:MAG: hypothetical protein K6V97_14795 [Actinomycetia bacterium]|nr:hypothetical protein [Actinomycetes bacterium]
MRRQAVFGTMVASVIIAVGGVVVTLHSTQWGLDAANQYLRVQMAGSMDTTTFAQMIRAYQTGYRMLGGVLFGVGLVTLLWHLPEWLSGHHSE